MTKEYLATLSRTETKVARITIYAENEDEAYKKAQDLINKQYDDDGNEIKFDDCVWANEDVESVEEQK